MSAYDDMPVGTVLRNPDDGVIYVKSSATVQRRPYWVGITSDGSVNGTFAIEMPPFLVELVEKLPDLRDRLNGLWRPINGLYHLPTCPANCDHGRTRQQLEVQWGPLTEDPS